MTDGQRAGYIGKDRAMQFTLLEMIRRKNRQLADLEAILAERIKEVQSDYDMGLIQPSEYLEKLVTLALKEER
jgi:hypothetical protein